MPTSGMKAWDRDLSDSEPVGWDAIWDDVTSALKNPNHPY